MSNQWHAVDEEGAQEPRRKQQERGAEWRKRKEPVTATYRGPVKGMEKAPTFDESW